MMIVEEQEVVKSSSFVPAIYLDEDTEEALTRGYLVLQRGQWLIRDIEEGRHKIPRKQKGRFIGVMPRWDNKEKKHKPTVFASWRKRGETLEQWNKRHSTACDMADKKSNSNNRGKKIGTRPHFEPKNPPYEFDYDSFKKEETHLKPVTQQKPEDKEKEYVIMLTRKEAIFWQIVLVLMFFAFGFFLFSGGLG